MSIFFENIAIIGRSKKFIKFVNNNLKYKSLTIIPWRNIIIKRHNKKKMNLIILCGYDYSSYKYEYNKFYKTNISQPYNLIKKYYKKNTVIIYINTTSNKMFTLSRYYYAKHKLNEIIIKNFNNVNSIELPTIVNSNNIDIFGSSFQKILFKFLIFFNLIKWIEFKNVTQKIKKSLQSPNQINKIKIKCKFLEIPRNIFLDRVLRIIVG